MPAYLKLGIAALTLLGTGIAVAFAYAAYIGIGNQQKILALEQERAELSRQLAEQERAPLAPSEREGELREEIDRLAAAVASLEQERAELSELLAQRDEASLVASQREGELQEEITRLTAVVASLEQELKQRRVAAIPSDVNAALLHLAERPGIEIMVGYGGLKASVFEPVHPEEAVDYYSRLIEQARSTEFKLGEAAAVEKLSLVLRASDPVKAAEYQQRAAGLAEDIVGFPVVMASVYDSLSLTEHALESIEEAEKFHQQAMRIAEEKEYVWGHGSANVDMGVIAFLAKEYDQAETHFHEALRLFESIDDKAGMAMTVQNLAILYATMKRPDEANEYRERSRSLIQDLRR